jgi:hypothetical protein
MKEILHIYICIYINFWEELKDTVGLGEAAQRHSERSGKIQCQGQRKEFELHEFRHEGISEDNTPKRVNSKYLK